MRKGIIGEATAVFGGICLLLIVITILGGIITRAVFNYPLSWSVELTSILVIWSVYAVFSLNYRDRTELSVNVFASLLSARGQKVLEVIADIVITVVLVVMLVHGVTAMRMNYGMTTMALDISVSLAYYLAAELGAAFLLGHVVMKYIGRGRGPRR